MTAPRVLIADDHPASRMGIRISLEQGGIEVCAEAADAAGAIEAALRERPDACLLDVSMPGGGTAAASTIAARVPETIVLMLTVSSRREDLIESLRRGASGYLLKGMDTAKLPVAVRAALSGEATIPASLTGAVIEELREGPRTRRLTFNGMSPRLTSREWEVLEVLCEGAGTAEIAERLFLSNVTVRRHISAIMAKLGVSSREELVRAALADDEPSASGRPGDGGPAEER